MLLNQPRALKLMERHGLDALIATNPNHVTYASNYGGHTPRIYEEKEAFAILPRDMSRAALLAPIGEASYLAEKREEVWVPEIWTYGTSKIAWPEDLQPDADEARLLAVLKDKEHNARSLPELLARVLGAKGLSGAAIGLDESGLTVDLHGKIKAACPKADFRPARAVWREIELIKTGEELARLRRAAQANEEAVAEVMGQVRAGVSEASLLQVYREAVARRGGALEFWNSAGGRRAGDFFQSGAYQLRKGDTYRFDAGMVLDHYHADTGGVAVLGPPTARQREIYATLTAGMRAALERARPGATYEDVWRAGVETVARRGIKDYDVLRSDLGHGIGIEPRVPDLMRGNTLVLEPGMVINVEVPYYEVGYGGFQLEYSLVVTAAGHEFLIPNSRDLWVKGG
ncbi:MAG: aminopeptidase P family protein [Candidatus Tectomicrobia bacterium]|nr:aminopeptidase P family protein [Candidatus Tectomicrobia bacterium]